MSSIPGWPAYDSGALSLRSPRRPRASRSAELRVRRWTRERVRETLVSTLGAPFLGIFGRGTHELPKLVMEHNSLAFSRRILYFEHARLLNHRMHFKCVQILVRKAFAYTMG